jgi:hypothetical protein
MQAYMQLGYYENETFRILEARWTTASSAMTAVWNLEPVAFLLLRRVYLGMTDTVLRRRLPCKQTAPIWALTRLKRAKGSEDRL